MLKVLADENIPALEDILGNEVELRRAKGRAIHAGDLVDIDALLVRSVTKVDQRLLNETAVRFVGSATIGTDHIDLSYLHRNGLSFASAPASNADSVADYVCAALAATVPDLSAVKGSGLRASVIGLGAVGSRVAKRLQALGYSVQAHDPFLSETKVSGVALVNLKEALKADLITLHVPLTAGGPHPTLHLLNQERLSTLSAQCLLINTARGPVIDNTALLNILDKRPGMHAVLDVWEFEPDIMPELVHSVSIATAHIAGYAWDGKRRGARMICEAMAQCFDFQIAKAKSDAIELRSLLGIGSINLALLKAYDIFEDDTALRLASGSREHLALEFDRLRKDYAVRREFSALSLTDAQALPAKAIQCLKLLGFGIEK